MAEADKETWTEIDHDAVSGRRIFKRDTAFGNGGCGGHHFEVEADFEVREPDGRVAMSTSGRAKGEYWCGTFLWFVKDKGGARVRLYQSDRDDEHYDVPSNAV